MQLRELASSRSSYHSVLAEQRREQDQQRRASQEKLDSLRGELRRSQAALNKVGGRAVCDVMLGAGCCGICAARGVSHGCHAQAGSA